MTYPSKSLNLVEIILDELGIFLGMEAVKFWMSVRSGEDVRTWDVVYFDLVLDPSAQYTSASRSIAVVLSLVEIGDVANGQTGDVYVCKDSLQLLFKGKLVESLTQCKLPIHFLLRNAIACNIKEPLGPDSFYELLGKRFLSARRVKLGEVDIGNYTSEIAEKSAGTSTHDLPSRDSPWSRRHASTDIVVVLRRAL